MARSYSAKPTGSPRRVSQARLSQKAGTRNAFGGYTKVGTGNGSFTMKKIGK
jgi:hypothetical protein